MTRSIPRKTESSVTENASMKTSIPVEISCFSSYGRERDGDLDWQESPGEEMKKIRYSPVLVEV